MLGRQIGTSVREALENMHYRDNLKQMTNKGVVSEQADSPGVWT